MDRWVGKVAVITGASSGIGLAVAKELVNHGLIVIGLARRKSKMENEMKDVKGQFYAMECDITNQKQVEETFQSIEKNFKSIHVLINNAGIVVIGKIQDLKYEEMLKVLNTNIIGHIHCSKLTLDIMKKRSDESHIIAINSLLGHRISIYKNYYSNVYAATKFGIRAYSESLKKEMCNENIRISSISPGPVRTEMVSSTTKDTDVQDNMLELEDIANAVLYILGTPKRVHIEDIIINSKINM